MSHPDTARTSSPRWRPCRRRSRNVGVRAAPVPAAELPGGPATADLPTAPSTCRYPRPPPTLPARPSPPRHLRGGLFASRQARAARAGGGEVTAAAGATHPSSPRPGRRADGEIRGSPRRAAGRRRTHTREVRRTCGPLAVDARQEPLLGASRVGQKLHELNDEFAIFKAWPSEQDRVAATRLPARARAQVGEGGGRQPLPPRVRAGLRTPASR